MAREIGKQTDRDIYLIIQTDYYHVYTSVTQINLTYSKCLIPICVATVDAIPCLPSLVILVGTFPPRLLEYLCRVKKNSI